MNIEFEVTNSYSVETVGNTDYYRLQTKFGAR